MIALLIALALAILGPAPTEDSVGVWDDGTGNVVVNITEDVWISFTR